jgi:hypothetical protein
MAKSRAEKLHGAKPPHVAVLDKPFAGVPTGARQFIASPGLVRDCVRAVPPGQTRAVAEMRADGDRWAVTPFWRLVEPDGALVRRLSCGPDFLAEARATERRR